MWRGVWCVGFIAEDYTNIDKVDDTSGLRVRLYTAVDISKFIYSYFSPMHGKFDSSVPRDLKFESLRMTTLDRDSRCDSILVDVCDRFT